MFSFCFPQVDQLRDKVDSGFYRHHKILLQASAKPQESKSKLFAALDLIIVPNKAFAHPFQIVNIKPKRMTQSVGKEHGMSPLTDSFINITLHNSKLFQSFGDLTGCKQMDIPEWNTGFYSCDRCQVCCQNDVINISLLL